MNLWFFKRNACQGRQRHSKLVCSDIFILGENLGRGVGRGRRWLQEPWAPMSSSKKLLRGQGLVRITMFPPKSEPAPDLNTSRFSPMPSGVTYIHSLKPGWHMQGIEWTELETVDGGITYLNTHFFLKNLCRKPAERAFLLLVLLCSLSRCNSMMCLGLT